MNRTLFTLLAEAFRYPHPGHLEQLERGLASLPPETPARPHLERFLRAVSALSLDAWEMLYTRTLDLSPLTAPYVGYQQWGENYRRGNFMSQLNAELARLHIPADGELPDHLIPVLRYLAAAETPLPELLENLAPAVDKMRAALRKAEKDNPYLFLFQAAREAAASLSRESVGG